MKPPQPRPGGYHTASTPCHPLRHGAGGAGGMRREPRGGAGDTFCPHPSLRTEASFKQGGHNVPRPATGAGTTVPGGRAGSRARAPSPHSLLLLLPLPPPRPGRRPPPWPAPAPVLVPAPPRGSPGSVHRQRGGEGMEKEKGKGTRVKPGGDYKSRQAALPPRLSPFPAAPGGRGSGAAAGSGPRVGFGGSGAVPSPPGPCRAPRGGAEAPRVLLPLGTPAPGRCLG